MITRSKKRTAHEAEIPEQPRPVKRRKADIISAVKFAVDSSLPLFWLLRTCPNVNISVRILGYADYRTKVLRTLSQLCRKSRSLINTHRGAICGETTGLSFRLSPPLTTRRRYKHDFTFPAPEKWSYHNPIVGAKQATGRDWGMNFVLEDGTTSGLPYFEAPESEYTEVKIPPDTLIRKVAMWGNKHTGCLWGLKFFCHTDKCLLEAGVC